MMKKIGIIISVFMLLLSGYILATEGETPIDSEELQISSGDSMEIIPIEEIEDVVKTDKGHNIMLFDRELDITGEAKDLILAAGSKITSKALGSYAFLAASELDISGEIFQDTFAVGNNIHVEGNIGRDFYALGNSISIDGTIERDVYAGGEEINITGVVKGDIRVVGGSLFIGADAVIEGNIYTEAGEIEIRNGASIQGTVYYQDSTQIVEIPTGIRTVIEKDLTPVQEEENSIFSSIKGLIWWLVANGLLFALIMLLTPGITRVIREVYQEDCVQKCVSSVGWGLLSLLIIPIISFLLLFTIIGSAIGIIGFLLYMIGYMIATVISGYVLACAFLPENKSEFTKGFLGILAIEILRRLPIIGGIISIIANALAFGTILKLISHGNAKKETPNDTEFPNELNP